MGASPNGTMSWSDIESSACAADPTSSPGARSVCVTGCEGGQSSERIDLVGHRGAELSQQISDLRTGPVVARDAVDGVEEGGALGEVLLGGRLDRRCRWVSPPPSASQEETGLRHAARALYRRDRKPVDGPMRISISPRTCTAMSPVKRHPFASRPERPLPVQPVGEAGAGRRGAQSRSRPRPGAVTPCPGRTPPPR